MVKQKADQRILDWIRIGIQQGVDLNTGDTVRGTIPESDNRHDGTYIAFEYTIQTGDIEASLNDEN